MFFSNDIHTLDKESTFDIELPKNISLKKFSSAEEWLIFRNSSIGSSDIAVIAGESHFSYPQDVFYRLVDNFHLEKYKERPSNFNSGPPSKAMMRGNIWEPHILQMYRDYFCRDLKHFALYHMGKTVFRNQDLVKKIIDTTEQTKVSSHSTPDAILHYYDPDTRKEEYVLLEIKTKGKTSPLVFGKEFTDQVPRDYYLQVQHQLLTFPLATRAEIVVLDFNGEASLPKRYYIQTDRTTQKTIEENICSFVNDYLKPDVVPILEPTNGKDEEVIFLKKGSKDPKEQDLLKTALDFKKAKNKLNLIKEESDKLSSKLKELVFDISKTKNLEKTKSIFLDAEFQQDIEFKGTNLKKPILKVVSTFSNVYDLEKILIDFPNLQAEIDQNPDIEALLQSGLLNYDVLSKLQKNYLKKEFRSARLDLNL